MADLDYHFGPWQRDAEQNAWRCPAGTVGMLDFGSLNDCALSPSERDSRGVGLFCVPRGTKMPSEYDLLDSGDCREIQVAAKHRDLVEAVLGVRIDAGGTLAEACASLFGAGDPTGQERWKPLMPNRSGNYEIRLGGHSQIWWRKFLGSADPTWNRLRDLLRHDLQKHGDNCKADAKALKDAAKELRKRDKRQQADALDAQAAKIEVHAEKALDAMCRKYGCLPSELSTTIRRGKAETTISDAFSSSLSGWTAISGTWSTRDAGSGDYRVIKAASGDFVWQHLRNATALSDEDHYAQAELYSTSGTAYAGVLTRCSVSGNLYCYYTQHPGGAQFALGKWVNGTRTDGIDPSKTFSSGAVIKLDSNGSTQTGTYNGTSSAWTDSSITGLYGVGLLSLTSYASYATQLDDFYATDGIADGWGKKIHGIAAANMAKVHGAARANIAKIHGV